MNRKSEQKIGLHIFSTHAIFFQMFSFRNLWYLRTWSPQTYRANYRLQEHSV